MEKDKRSAGAVNVAFEEPSFRHPSLSHQTRLTDAKNGKKSFACLSEFAFAVLCSFRALCSHASDMDMKPQHIWRLQKATKPG